MELSLLCLCVGILIPHVAFTAAKGLGRLNIALHKPAKQSSEYDYDGNGFAKFAVDGCLDNDFLHHCCSHTSVKTTSRGLFEKQKSPQMNAASNLTPSEWWEVDLKGYYRLGTIRILNRYGDPPLLNRLHDVTIEVFQNERNPRGKNHYDSHDGPAGKGWLILECKPQVRGRFVRITKPKIHPEDALTLCEVETYENLEMETFTSHHWHFKKQSNTFPLKEGHVFRSKSSLHCAAVCGSTSKCPGFSVGKEDEMKKVICQIETEYPKAGGDLRGRILTSFFKTRRN